MICWQFWLSYVNLYTGMVLVFDFTGYSLSHLANVNMAMTKKLMPVWEVNTKKITSQKWQTIWPYITVRLYNFKKGCFTFTTQKFKLCQHSVDIYYSEQPVQSSYEREDATKGIIVHVLHLKHLLNCFQLTTHSCAFHNFYISSV